MKTSLGLLALILFGLLAASILLPRSNASALHDCEVGSPRDLGAWDDAFVCKEKDLLILRRGGTLYSLSMVEGAKPKEIATAAALANTRIHACIASDENMWVFLNSTETDVFAVEANSGKVAEFKIPNLTIPGSHTPQIQSCISVPQADSVILMIAGGDRATWPRDGNRPLFFWMSLHSGQVVRFPIGWDLDHFSGDERIAVFEKTPVERFQRRPLQAVDMRTGEYSEALPDRKESGFVPFDWTDTQPVKPLDTRHEKTGDQNWFAGLSVNGHAYGIDLKLEKPSYLAQAAETDGFIAFRLREGGGSHLEPSPLWLVKAENPTTPQLVAPAATDFTVLKDGNLVLTTNGHGIKKNSEEAFFRASQDKTMRNVLDGVSRLPELGQEWANEKYIRDRMTVSLVTGFGKQAPIVLCVFTHQRGDYGNPPSKVPAPIPGTALDDLWRMTLKSESWRRAVLVTSAGERCMTTLFREARKPDRTVQTNSDAPINIFFPLGAMPDKIWLHNSGLLITGFTKAGKTHLFSYTLQLPHHSR